MSPDSELKTHHSELVLIIMVTERLCQGCHELHPHRYSIFDKLVVLTETCGGCGRKRAIGQEVKP